MLVWCSQLDYNCAELGEAADFKIVNERFPALQVCKNIISSHVHTVSCVDENVATTLRAHC